MTLLQALATIESEGEESEGDRERRDKRRKENLHPNLQSYHATPQKPQYAQPDSSYTYHIKLLTHLPPSVKWRGKKLMMVLNMIRRGVGGLDGI